MAYTTRETTILARAVRSANASTDVDNEGGHRGVIIFIDMIAVGGAPGGVTFTIRGKSTLSNQYYTMLGSAPIKVTGNTVLRLYPGGLVTAGLSANDQLPAVWNLLSAHSAGTNFTYSVNAILLP